jgi:hypothetical protein
MMDYLIGQINAITQAANDTYGVNPAIFLTIYLICVPIFYYSLFKIISSLTQKAMNIAMAWILVFLAATIAPFLYVMIFGRNIPWWVYIVIAAILVQGIYSLTQKIRIKNAK